MSVMVFGSCAGPSPVYTSTKPFRTTLEAEALKMGETSKTDAAVWKDPEDGRPYMGFVEVDDHGELCSLEQLRMVSATVEQAAKRAKIFHLIVFAHGWENNASPYNEENGNLKNFTKTIKAMREDPAHRKAGVEVMGVYVGWRGKTVGLELPAWAGLPMKVDFYHGMARAERVGKGVGITHALYDLSGSARKHRPASSRVIFVGHSFGAIVMENAINKAMASNLVRVASAGSSEKVVPPADLILLVNSAQTSIISKQFVDMLRTLEKDKGFALKADGRESNHRFPLIVSATSEKDSATSFWFPTGIVVGRYIMRFSNTGVAGHYRSDYKRDGYTKSQNYTHRHTAGHNEGLFSHSVVESNETSGGTARAEYVRRYPGYPSVDDRVMAISSNQHYRSNVRSDGSILIRGINKDYLMRAGDEKDTYNRTPFWITQMPASMVKSHGGIWTEEFAGFATAMLHLALAPPTQRRAPRAGERAMGAETMGVDVEEMSSRTSLPQLYFQKR